MPRPLCPRAWPTASWSTGPPTPSFACCRRSSSPRPKPARRSIGWTRRSAPSEPAHELHRQPSGGVRRSPRMTPSRTADRTVVIPGGVTTPQGFRAAGIAAGIKRPRPDGTAPLDLAVLISDTPATAAAMFTVNKAQAAPVLVSREHITRSGGIARAIIVNSGCANACTGDEGVANARVMASETARLAGCREDEVLVASTGVIGVGLPIEKITSALPRGFAALGADQGPAAARAIMTTDPFPKEAAVRVVLDGREAVIGGMAKGSGMIEPMMATMLAFVTTDASVPQPLLQRALRDAVNTK